MSYKIDTLIILGNGFDLDIGLLTSYKSFWNAKKSVIERYCEKGRISPMSSFVAKECDKFERWIDLEDFIRRYTTSNTLPNEGAASKALRAAGQRIDNARLDDKYVSILKNELCAYLSTQQEREDLDVNSCAARILAEYGEHANTTFWNFNYTDIRDFAQKCNINPPNSVKHIHGTLAEKNIVLGIGEERLFFDENYTFLRKRYQGAKEAEFKSDLAVASKVIFFGIAFGNNDMQYFRDFFHNVAEKKQYSEIQIFTYNRNSQKDIENQLQNIGIKVDPSVFYLTKLI